MKYEPIDTPITGILEEVLARSMDKERVFEVHPAFVQIIRSLSPTRPGSCSTSRASRSPRRGGWSTSSKAARIRSCSRQAS